MKQTATVLTNGKPTQRERQGEFSDHFYALLITALLELRLKQHCVAACEAVQSADSVPRVGEACAFIASLIVDPERLADARGHTFLAAAGEKLQYYWKIGKHWLAALHNFPVRPFDYQVMLALGRL